MTVGSSNAAAGTREIDRQLWARTDGGSVSAGEASIVDWLERVRGEYSEMPGLCLTERQAQRLWGLDSIRCRALLDALLQAGFLRRTNHGGYTRADR